MIRAEMEAWLEDKMPREAKERERSDFLAYENHTGLYADFHSFRHLFITSLERAGIRPRMAQTLARHSDIPYAGPVHPRRTQRPDGGD